MWSKSKFFNDAAPADLVTFTEEILNGKLYFLCSAASSFRRFVKAIILTISIRFFQAMVFKIREKSNI